MLDARAAERYRGEIEPIDPRAGHVPGAVSAPTTANLAPDGTFLRMTELVDRFVTLGVGPRTTVGVYCGSGSTPPTRSLLSPPRDRGGAVAGSWSQWAADPARPASTGPQS